MAKPRRHDSGGEESPGHLGREPNRGPVSEQLPCIVLRSTPDGYVVGRALVNASDVTWVSPTHVRPWTETRPTDVRIPPVTQASLGGEVELKPARMAKGAPVPTTVGYHVAFGEQLDAAALRARGELRKQFDSMVKARRSYWRHLCKECPSDWRAPNEPLWLGTPRGETCPHCGAVEKAAPKVSAA